MIYTIKQSDHAELHAELMHLAFECGLSDIVGMRPLNLNSLIKSILRIDQPVIDYMKGFAKQPTISEELTGDWLFYYKASTLRLSDRITEDKHIIFHRAKLMNYMATDWFDIRLETESD